MQPARRSRSPAQLFGHNLGPLHWFLCRERKAGRPTEVTSLTQFDGTGDDELSPPGRRDRAGRCTFLLSKLRARCTRVRLLLGVNPAQLDSEKPH